MFDDGFGEGGLEVEGVGDFSGGGLVDIDGFGGELGEEIVRDFGPLVFFAFGAAADHVLNDAVPAVAGFAAADEVAEAVAGTAEALGGGAAGAFWELLGVVGGEEVGGEGEGEEGAHALFSYCRARDNGGRVMRWILLIGALGIAGCTRPAGERPIGRAVTIRTPLGLPPLPVPDDNPPTVETVALGKKLYFDTKLSADGSVACASCHAPEKGFGDGRRTAQGVRQQTGNRNAPTVLNAAYSPRQFWDGRAGSLEEQAAGPIANPIEMNLPHGECVERLNRDAEYRGLFEKAFGPGAIGMTHVQKAIAAFERTLVTGNSPFDRYLYGGERAAMSEAAVRGMGIFMDKERGNCTACHLAGPKAALFTDGLFHNVGAGMNAEGELVDLGRYNETKVEADKGAFKTPSLRNVAQTGPYMHDGKLKTLREVVDFYVGGGSSNANLDRQIRPLALTGRDREDLVAFLEALTGELAHVQ